MRLTTYVFLLFVFQLSIAQTMTYEQADTQAQKLIAQMSLKQKVHEMHGHGMLRFGTSILFSKKVKPVKAGGNKRLQIPPTVFLDGPRGVSFYKGATAFPTTVARGASWDVDLEKRVGEAIAEEVRALGANYSGAVCMNLLRHPAWGRAQETYGEDPYHVGEMASALVQGIEKHNVQACAKHFAANSMENNRFGGSINMDERTLHEVYLPHFKKVIERGCASVMSAYNQLNGEYCGHSKMLLTDILREQWGFRGYVTSDWMWGLMDAQKGIEAGMNVEMPTDRVYSLRAIKKLLRDGKICEQQIDDLILPTLRTKLFFAAKKELQEYPKTLVGCRAHIELAQEAAEKSAVLLKNENNFLPLDKNKIKTVAVIGTLAQTIETGDHGSSRVYPDYVVSPLQGIQNYLSKIQQNFEPYKVLTAPVDDLTAIKTICGKADAVIVVAGTTYKDEGEYIGDGKIRSVSAPDKKSLVTRTGILALGGDRKYLHLHQQDIDVIHTATSVNKNVVVSLIAGSAVTVEEWHNEVPAIIETFYNGMEGGNALARILFGDVNPSGKLPFSVPKNETDLPPFNSYAKTAEYGYYHGYTYYDMCERNNMIDYNKQTGEKGPRAPRYPFGYGLSYTQFQISGLSTNTISDTCTVAVKIKNIGARAGAEVVQLYINFPGADMDRPIKLLRGFNKVFLQPNEESEVHMAVPFTELAYYDAESKSWKTEKGKYEVWVGNSSRDEKMLKGNFEID